MIVEYIRYTVEASRAHEFTAAYETAAESLRASPHCLGYELTQCTEARDGYILRILWDSEEGHMKGFRTSPQFQSFFAVVKPFVKDIVEMRHYALTSIQWSRSNAVPTLLDWMGGTKALEGLFAAFYARVPSDPVLGPVFEKMSPDHAKHVAAFVGEVFGGPAVYSEKHGGHRNMIQRHVGRALTEEQRSRWMQLLLECADEIGVPKDPEFRSALVAYLEWGTRLAVLNSKPGETIEGDAPMPKWGWGEAKGPYIG